MKLLVAALMLLLIVQEPQHGNVHVEAAVGLYGPDRYEGLPNACLLQMDFGYCRAKIQRYYFDIRRMKCTMFYWGGCAGNDNNFKSMDECNDFCQPGGGYYREDNSIVQQKRERGVAANANDYTNNAGAKFSGRSSSSSNSNSNSKSSAPKFTAKNAPAFRDSNQYNASNNNAGALKASAKSFNVNPTPKAYKQQPAATTDPLDDEDYDD